MKLAVALLAAFPLAAQIPPPPPAPQPVKPGEGASISGIVRNAATGEPLANARVVLHSGSGDALPPPPPPPPGGRGGFMMRIGASSGVAVSTDSSGRFTTNDLAAGDYTLSAERNGFSTTLYGAHGRSRNGTRIHLTRGDKVTDIEIRLQPWAVIAGRVVDQDGDVIEGAQVSAMQTRYMNGKKEFAPVLNAETDDRGEYRIFGLAPGQYYLSAKVSGMPGATPSAYPETFYPGTPDTRLASPLDVAAGAELTAVDIPLNKTTTVTVSGKIANQTGIDGTPAVMVMSADGPRGGFRPARVGPGGAFEIPGLQPGSYQIYAGISDGAVSHSVRYALNVGTSDIKDLTIPLLKALDLSGDLSIEGGDLTPDALLVRTTRENSIALRIQTPAGGLSFGSQSSAKPEPNGKFVLSNVSADSCRIALSGVPSGYYLKSIRMGDQDILAPGIDLATESPGTIHIVVAKGAADVDGAVNGAQQNPIAGATVVLIPDGPLGAINEFVKSAITDKDGKFALHDLRPGVYKAYAWQDVDQGAWMDPAFLKPFLEKATPLTLPPASHQDLPLTPIDE